MKYRLSMGCVLIIPYLSLLFLNHPEVNTYPINELIRSLLIVVTMLLLCIEWMRIKTPQQIEKVSDKGMLSGFIVSFTLGVPLCLKSPIESDISISMIIGLTLFLTGIFLRYWSIHCLGKYYSHAVRMDVNHKIIQEGPYAYIRHPIYTATTLLLLGNVMVLNNSFHCLWLLAFSLLGINRVIKEENQLISNFGSQYAEYMKKSKRFIPFIFLY